MLLGTVLLWALNITVTKYMFEHGWRPLAYGTIRYFAAISLFWVFTYWRERSFRIAPRATCSSSLLAALMIFLQPALLRLRLKLATRRRWRCCSARRRSSSALISLAFGLERLHAHLLDRRAITFAGVALIALAAAASARASGTLIAIATALTWACYSVAIAPLMRRYSPFRISSLVLAIGWVPLALVGVPQIARADSSSAG